MDFQYSTTVDLSRTDTQGLCNGVPIRKYLHPEKENRGSLRAQMDWNRLVSPVGLYKGNLAPEYNFIQMIIPECHPERYEILSYSNEIAFLYDGTIFINIRPKLCEQTY